MAHDICLNFLVGRPQYEIGWGILGGLPQYDPIFHIGGGHPNPNMPYWGGVGTQYTRQTAEQRIKQEEIVQAIRDKVAAPIKIGWASKPKTNKPGANRHHMVYSQYMHFMPMVHYMCF